MRFATLATAVTLAILPVLGVNFDVSVGANNGLIFAPNTISGAVAGDTITFTFVSRIHSATTTTFVNPCPPPLGGSSSSPDVFDSGFQDATTGSQPVSVMNITTSDTQFISCRQAAGAHCQAGMLLVVNPTAELSFSAFAQNAATDPLQN
ncbi:hypothetical protein D9758_014076 [Tetrapyrgos nigripes]|uniref:Uncharacterized protein n=1 Tax=Tetrapyrgos nigripes TaxID=182062 RepID=A0A8H5CHI9_9AGAR|nr:hypothetical protein D9758_014076 [Tetrapyrgos nigripes]